MIYLFLSIFLFIICLKKYLLTGGDKNFKNTLFLDVILELKWLKEILKHRNLLLISYFLANPENK